MVGYIGGSVDVLPVTDISGDGILNMAGGGRIGRPGKGEIFGKGRDEVGILGIVTMCSLLWTSQTAHCVNIWPKHKLHLVTVAGDKVNRTAYHLLELPSSVRFPGGVMRPLALTEGQPYRACAAPDTESKQQDCSLNRGIQVGRNSARKDGYQHRPPLDRVIESNAWKTVVGGETLECAKISRHFVAVHELEHYMNASKQDQM